MAGLAVKGCARAAVSCTFSTAGFQTSRNGVQALLAEAFGNSSVLSQHVTKGIINLLHSIAAFSDILEPKQKSIRLAPALLVESRYLASKELIPSIHTPAANR